MPNLVFARAARLLPRNFAAVIDRRVATRIRARRLQIGMTQQQLASLIGVAFQQAYKYEHGLSRISAGRLYQIGTALEVSIGYFFAEESVPVQVRRIGAGAHHGD